MNLVIAPDPLLKKKSLPVAEVDAEIRKLMDDMLETMHHEEGIGLSAVQVGVLKRVIVLQLTKEHNMQEPLFMANPEIITTSPECSSFNEGCLSFPTQRIEIQRPMSIRVRFIDYHNQVQEIDYEALLATAIQHEIDHTNGILISDHASKLKGDMMLRRAKKIKNT
jgi:peptide deformylase